MGGFAFGVNPETAAETETELALGATFSGYEEFSLLVTELLLAELTLVLLCRAVGDEV